MHRLVEFAESIYNQRRKTLLVVSFEPSLNVLVAVIRLVRIQAFFSRSESKLI